MTIAAALWRRTFSLPPAEDRLFAVDAESQILGHCHWQEGKRRDTPVIALVHGLEGSSDSGYMKGIAEKAWISGFHVVRLNQRNCGGTELLTPTLYNSGMSGDYRAVFEELANADGFEKIFFAGYSMGGNLVTKMAGEFGEKVPSQLRGVCSVCPALDLAACADELERWDNYFYEERFVRGLLKRYARKVELFPRRYSKNGFGPIRTVREFDDAITAPSFGFRDAVEYYESAGAKKVIGAIRLPYLLITAQDDPFVPFTAIRAAGAEKNPHIQLVAPEHGGHCGFVSRHAGGQRFWAEEKIVEFCREQLQN
ncbi:MAG: alpha/beta fold hydrolase [Acidobacteria bacterium]|nr:alpha/beta fold hydrolase [Acidobacteriota bacterium]MBS1867300.1 alpha/beta fold hydrolase [Acidobacteriota bacterium]